MQLGDLLRVCLQNLLRRKSRTLLTVLGVVIGCCSIVIMISIGIGMRVSQQKMLAEMGDLTIITVRGGSGKRAKLNAAAVKSFREIEGVEAATPKIDAEGVRIRLYAGDAKRYLCEYPTVAGIDSAVFEKLGYKLLEGRNIAQSGTEAVAGQYFSYDFRDTMRPEGYNMVDLYSMYQPDGTVTEPPKPYFPALDAPLTLEVEIGAAEDNKKLNIPLKVCGVAKEDYAKGYETSQGLILDFHTLTDILAQARKMSGSQGDPNAGYASVLVKVKELGQVAEAEKSIKRMGFQTSSMESIREPMEKEARQKQLMLGGLGAVSLFVAALGITNTMIMSISERTREIGVMKALGCYVHDIRAMFLIEAGFIGLSGGVIGSALSMGLSLLLNLFGASALGAGGNGAVSVIPPWLIAFAVFFSVCIGLGSGYYPANKAVRIPVLEAIRQE